MLFRNYSKYHFIIFISLMHIRLLVDEWNLEGLLIQLWFKFPMIRMLILGYSILWTSLQDLLVGIACVIWGGVLGGAGFSGSYRNKYKGNNVLLKWRTNTQRVRQDPRSHGDSGVSMHASPLQNMQYCYSWLRNVFRCCHNTCVEACKG